MERWPKTIRWLLFLPAAVLASMIAHFVLTLALPGTGADVSLLGIGIEGSGARRIAFIWREGLMRFVEPWVFVATAGVVAPARKVPSIATAAAISLLLFAILGMQLKGGEHDPVIAVLRFTIAVVGAAAGALTAMRSKPRGNGMANDHQRVGCSRRVLKSVHDKSVREDVPEGFLELLSKLD
jgi:hypothetical protein